MPPKKKRVSKKPTIQQKQKTTATQKTTVSVNIGTLPKKKSAKRKPSQKQNPFTPPPTSIFIQQPASQSTIHDFDKLTSILRSLQIQQERKAEFAPMKVALPELAPAIPIPSIQPTPMTSEYIPSEPFQSPNWTTAPSEAERNKQTREEFSALQSQNLLWVPTDASSGEQQKFYKERTKATMRFKAGKKAEERQQAFAPAKRTITSLADLPSFSTAMPSQTQTITEQIPLQPLPPPETAPVKRGRGRPKKQ